MIRYELTMCTNRGRVRVSNMVLRDSRPDFEFLLFHLIAEIQQI